VDFRDYLNELSKMRDSTRSSSGGNKSHNSSRVNNQRQAKKLERMGRDGDTQLVHVNKQEERMLKNAGGRGSVNPKTGLREYMKSNKIPQDFRKQETRGKSVLDNKFLQEPKRAQEPRIQQQFKQTPNFQVRKVPNLPKNNNQKNLKEALEGEYKLDFEYPNINSKKELMNYAYKKPKASLKELQEHRQNYINKHVAADNMGTIFNKLKKQKAFNKLKDYAANKKLLQERPPSVDNKLYLSKPAANKKLLQERPPSVDNKLYLSKPTETEGILGMQPGGNYKSPNDTWGD
jgi:hypothetical protein